MTVQGKKAIIEITEQAAKQMHVLLNKRARHSLGLRIGTKSGGCSGRKYYMDYTDTHDKYDEVVEYKGIKIFIDGKELMYLIGTKIDYITDAFRTKFVFDNPNEKASCGCGKSFNV